jgi:UDP-2,3-diacylglucosamine hydrolase
MLAALISDVHLVGLNDPTQDALVALLDGLHTPELVILGDLFHFWWGFPGVIDVDLIPTVAALHRLARRGVRLRYVPGNHDFAVGETLTSMLGLEVASRLDLTWGGRRYVLVHGDEADTTRGYALTRFTLRGPLFAALMWALGPARGRRCWAYGSPGDPAPSPLTNRSLGSSRRSALGLRAELRAGRADVVVMGHSHQP